MPAFFASVLVGNLLHGLSDPFDRIATLNLSAKTKAYLNDACKTLKIPKGIPEHPENPSKPKKTKNLFYAAFSFIRIHDLIAVAELERQAADYKLFRSLTLLFLLETFNTTFQFSLVRLVLSALITCFAAIRYLQLFDWCYTLAFDLYNQIMDKEKSDAASKASSKNR